MKETTMPKFSATSQEKLDSCDARLRALFAEVIKHYDCTIICGHRGKADQDAAVKGGFSKTPFPKSKHNKEPSLAVDVMPYPIDWKNRERIIYFAGQVMGIAKIMGVPVRWGGDWDKDGDTKDEKFSDTPHFELV